VWFVYLLHIGFDLRGRSRGGGEVEDEARLSSILRLGGRTIRICEFWRDGRKSAGVVDFCEFLAFLYVLFSKNIVFYL
jgi:hypothetical protein